MPTTSEGSTDSERACMSDVSRNAPVTEAMREHDAHDDRHRPTLLMAVYTSPDGGFGCRPNG